MEIELKEDLKAKLKPIRIDVKKIFESDGEFYEDEVYDYAVKRLNKLIDKHTETEIVVYLLMNLINSEVVLHEE